MVDACAYLSNNFYEANLVIPNQYLFIKLDTFKKYNYLYLRMFQQLLNWRTALALLAIGIVTGTIFYSQYLAKKIAADERRKVNVWVQSLKTRSTTTEQSALERK
jgi:hypothetical protein